ncbi:MAG: hypothetical protein EOP11_04550 [Proteobacteria bacterium]|nr:MAG: hypothetical protein EOP11_04550 [Pseudomonadota bacterium]
MNNNRKSKSLLINPAFQLSVISWFASLSLAIIGIFFGAFLLLFRDMKAQGQAAGLPPGHALFQYIQAQETHFYQIFCVSGLIAVAVILVGGIWLSHKVAGPLHRLTCHLRDSRPDSAAPVKFRTGDYFPEIESTFNEFIARK